MLIYSPVARSIISCFKPRVSYLRKRNLTKKASDLNKEFELPSLLTVLQCASASSSRKYQIETKIGEIAIIEAPIYSSLSWEISSVPSRAVGMPLFPLRHTAASGVITNLLGRIHSPNAYSEELRTQTLSSLPRLRTGCTESTDLIHSLATQLHLQPLIRTKLDGG